MKKLHCDSNIGEGLFTNDPVDVELEHPDGTVSEWRLYALTPRRVMALKKSGVKFENYDNEEEALRNSEAVIGSIVHSGKWRDTVITEDNKHDIIGNMGLTTSLISAARFLAEERQETETKNSEN